MCPRFFHYHSDIENELIRNGYAVDSFDDRIKQSSFNKVLKKIFKRTYAKKTYRYLYNICERKKNIDYKYVIVVLGLDYSESSMELLHLYFKNATFIYYAWDSIGTYPQIKRILPYFQKKYSFDPYDCLENGVTFLPLFYSEQLSLDCDKRYSYSCVTSYFPNKDRNICLALKAVSKVEKGFIHLYIKSLLFFVYLKIKYRSKIHVKLKDVSFRKIGKEELKKIFRESFATVDAQLDKQRGLTIRTFEALSSKTKLITTNKDIERYSFFNANNIFVVEEGKIIPDSFFETPFDDNYRLEIYSIETFTKVLIGKIKPQNYLK